MKSYQIFLVIFINIVIRFNLFPIDRHTTSDTDIWECIIFKLDYFFSLVIISYWLIIIFRYSSMIILWSWINFASSINHKIITIFRYLIILNIPLHNWYPPTDINIIFFKYPYKILIPKESIISTFLIIDNILQW